MTQADFLDVLKRVYEGEGKWPKPAHLLQGFTIAEAGASVEDAARRVGTTSKRLGQVVESMTPVLEAIGADLGEISEDARTKAKRQLGQLLLGRCAEIAFENIYKREMHTQELELRDLREDRSNTDYRLLNGGGRPIYRINIKFHGSAFRRAPEMVQLEPDDCFALATYKIQSALNAQVEDQLPYIFAIVGVPQLTGMSVGEAFPDAFVDTLAAMLEAHKKPSIRDFEDRMVALAVREDLRVFKETYAKIEGADWYILSARRAYRLLKEKLFERVYALRVRGFAQQFRSAEVDMHFSLSDDLIRLQDFLTTLETGGMARVTTLLERGEF